MGTYLPIKTMVKLKKVKSGDVAVTRENLPFFIEKLSKPCKNWLTENLSKPLKESLEIAFEWKEKKDHYDSNPTASNKIALRQKYIELIERSECLLPRARTYIYSALTFGESEFLSRNFQLPKLSTQSIFLHNDSDVIDYLKDPQLAAAKIQGAIKQTHQPYSWIVEVIKNCREAGAKNIALEVHLDPEGQIVICITDDGRGMGKGELKALKTPGYTSKLREEHDPNFGWGFFTLFNEFDTVYVSTSQDSSEPMELLFEKKEDTITLQQEPLRPQSGKGTKLIFKKNTKNPSQELLNLKVQFTNTCIQLKDTSITFQNFPLTVSSSTTIDAAHTEIFFENGEEKGPIKFELSGSKEGLYWKDLRLGSLADDYFDLLPSSIKKALENKGRRFCISLPHVEHNMNRNHLLNKSALSETIQRGILWTSLQYYANTCLKDGEMKEVSEDFWNDFRINYNNPNPYSLQLANALQKRDLNLAWPQKCLQEQQQILESCKSYFYALSKDCSLKSPLKSKHLNATEAIQCIENTAKEKKLKTLNAHMKEYLSDQRLLAEVMVHLPVNHGDFFSCGPT